MSWGMIVAGGVAGGAGLLAGTSAGGQNKKLRSYMTDLQPYQGEMPPKTEFLRPVEALNARQTMENAQGAGLLGLDPSLRAKLMEQYSLAREPEAEQARSGFINQLSGQGLSRNLGARDALLGQYQREADRSKRQYELGVDIQDLMANREDREGAKQRMARLNEFQFGQDTRSALAQQQAWSDYNRQLLGQGGLNAGIESQTSSPWGEGLSAGISTFGAMAPLLAKKKPGPTDSRGLGIGMNPITQSMDMRQSPEYLRMMGGRVV